MEVSGNIGILIFSSFRFQPIYLYEKWQVICESGKNKFYRIVIICISSINLGGISMKNNTGPHFSPGGGMIAQVLVPLISTISSSFTKAQSIR